MVERSDFKRNWRNRIVGLAGGILLTHVSSKGLALNIPPDLAGFIGWCVGNSPWALIGTAVGGELLRPGNLRNKLIALGVVGGGLAVLLIRNRTATTADEGVFTLAFFGLMLVALASRITRRATLTSSMRGRP